MDEPAGAIRTFVADLGAALRAWRLQTSILLLSILIESGPYAITTTVEELLGYPGCLTTRAGCERGLGLAQLATMILVVVFAGWFGTERIWYLRTFRGERLRREEVWLFTSAYRRRYLVLGLIFALALIPGLVVALLGTGGAVVFLVWTFFLDAALTFVTPALAFSTHRVSEAWRIGLRLARRAWPRSALYLFIPPLAARLAAATLWSSESSLLAVLLADSGAVLLLLLFKGATANFYLRYHDASEDGPAFPPPNLEGGYALGR